MSRLHAFLRLWAMLLLSYALARLGIDYLLRQTFDIRLATGLEYVMVSAGQAIVYWLVTSRRPAVPPPT